MSTANFVRPASLSLPILDTTAVTDTKRRCDLDHESCTQNHHRLAASPTSIYTTLHAQEPTTQKTKWCAGYDNSTGYDAFCTRIHHHLDCIKGGTVQSHNMQAMQCKYRELAANTCTRRRGEQLLQRALATQTCTDAGAPTGNHFSDAFCAEPDEVVDAFCVALAAAEVGAHRERLGKQPVRDADILLHLMLHNYTPTRIPSEMAHLCLHACDCPLVYCFKSHELCEHHHVALLAQRYVPRCGGIARVIPVPS